MGNSFTFFDSGLFCRIARVELQRFFAGAALPCTGLLCMLVFSVRAFSFWKGDSAHWAWAYLRTDFPWWYSSQVCL